MPRDKVLKEKARPKINEENKELLIYPNPANDFLNIIIPDCDDCIGKFIIFDISGKEVYSENLNQNSNQISLSEMNSGIYIVKVITNNEIIVKKILINK